MLHLMTQKLRSILIRYTIVKLDQNTKLQQKNRFMKMALSWKKTQKIHFGTITTMKRITIDDGKQTDAWGVKFVETILVTGLLIFLETMIVGLMKEKVSIIGGIVSFDDRCTVLRWRKSNKNWCATKCIALRCDGSFDIYEWNGSKCTRSNVQ